MEIITANSNPKIKNINKLNKNASFRKEEQVFIVEGIRMFRELPVDRVKQVFVSETAYQRYGTELPEKGITEQDGRLVVVSDSVFQSMSQTKTPQGLLAVVERYHYTMEDLISVMDKRENGNTFLVLESIQDPGNLGTIVRTAEAADVTGIIIGGDSCDIYNPKVVRSTMGTIFRVPFVYVDDPAKAVDRLKEHGIVVYGAHLDGCDLYAGKLKRNNAFLIGNEGNGLTDELSSKADRLLRIPMAGQVESLNAAISATLLAYEAYRQRR